MTITQFELPNNYCKVDTVSNSMSDMGRFIGKGETCNNLFM